MELKVLIADDDDGMRLVLGKVLKKIEGFTLIGEAADGEAAIRLFEEHRPQVVFLDVEMPLVDGIECARRITDIAPETRIIFATAHGEYMPDAFEVYAFDYLIKPFRLERISQSLERIKESLVIKPEAQEIRNPLAHKSSEKLIIRNKDGISLIDTDEIILIQREDRSTAIYTDKERFTTSEGLSDLEERLDTALFFRSHKSYIINLKSVSKIYPYGRWTYIVKLKGTEKDALMTHEKYVELENMYS
ncbi:MAG: response regulator transcription factor [Clostridiales bacterium]|nr:response regulator transcription factor [Clostridiales bacterium]